MGESERMKSSLARSKQVAASGELQMDEPWFPREVLATQAVDVSILIVTWNSARWIERCLRSLPSACEGLRWEVLVHDNASTDETRRVVEGASSDSLRFEAHPTNLGFAGGMNRALGSARGRFLMFLNPDCVAEAGSITRLVAHLDERPELGAVVPLLVGEDGVPQREFQLRRFPTLKSLAAGLLLLDELIPGNAISAKYRYRDLDIERAQRVEQPAGAAMLLRRRTIEALGPLDESFRPAWFEDVDYCRRMHELGEGIDLLPDAAIHHRGGTSLDHLPWQDFLRVWYRNLARYSRKWFSPGEAEVLRWLIMLGMVLRIGAITVGLSKVAAPRRDAIRAHLAVLREAFERWDESRSS